jgi:FtsZ-interacting cell division protein ZipA
MANRLMALLGMAIVLTAIAAAMLAGAASAAAETGTGSDDDGTKTSESKEEPSAESESDSDKPTATAVEQSPETSEPTDQPKKRKTSHPTAKTTKPPTAKSAAPNTKAAPAADKPVLSAHETAATPAESSTEPQQPPSVVVSASQSEIHESTTVAMSARSTAVVTEQATAQRRPTVINTVGSIVLNVVMGLIHTFDGAPVLPAGSTVTVRTSTLTIPVAGGRTVQADWYFPDDDGETPTRLIYFQHGLGRPARCTATPLQRWPSRLTASSSLRR